MKNESINALFFHTLNACDAAALELGKHIGLSSAELSMVPLMLNGKPAGPMPLYQNVYGLSRRWKHFIKTGKDFKGYSHPLNVKGSEKDKLEKFEKLHAEFKFLNDLRKRFEKTIETLAA